MPRSDEELLARLHAGLAEAAESELLAAADTLTRINGCPDLTALAAAAGPRVPRIIGLDLSIAAPGFADIDGNTHTLKLAAKLGDARLVEIAREAVKLAMTGHAWRADLAVIEDLPTHAHGAGITGMVHGAVRAALIDALVPYVTVPPASLKKYATGKGNADKTAMAIAALKRCGREFADDNQCDAFWLRAMGLAAYGHPLAELPAVQVEALGKVAWPRLGVLERAA